MPQNYVIAIPSHNRHDRIVKKTLSAIKGLKNIYVFVCDDTQKKAYESTLPKNVKIVVTGVKGIRKARNFISEYFPKNTNVVSIDDDINKFVIKSDDKLKDLTKLNKFFNSAFDITRKYNTKLWGLYPVPNPFFMKDNITTGLKMIVGWCFGFISHPSKKLLTNLVEQKEDYERTFRYFDTFGAVVRFNYISAKTTYYAKGGLTDVIKDRKQDMVKAAHTLHKHFPQYVDKVFYRKDGTGEIKLKTIKKDVLPHLNFT